MHKSQPQNWHPSRNRHLKRLNTLSGQAGKIWKRFGFGRKTTKSFNRWICLSALSPNNAKANATILLGKSILPHHQIFCSCATHWNLNPRRSQQRSCFLESQNVRNKAMRRHVWCDCWQRRGCDSSELHILYLSNFLLRNSGTHCKIAQENQKQQWSKKVPGNDMFVMSDSWGRSGMSTDKSPPPKLWWLQYQLGPFRHRNCFCFRWNSAQNAPVDSMVKYYVLYIFYFSCWGFPPIFVASVKNAVRYHHSHCIIQLESHQQLLKPCSVGLTFKAAEISSWKVGFIHR